MRGEIDNLSGSNPHQGMQTGLYEQGDVGIGRQAPVRHEHVPGLQGGMNLLDSGQLVRVQRRDHELGQQPRASMEKCQQPRHGKATAGLLFTRLAEFLL